MAFGTTSPAMPAWLGSKVMRHRGDGRNPGRVADTKRSFISCISLSSLKFSDKRISTIFQNLKIRMGGRAATQPVLPPQHRRARPTPSRLECCRLFRSAMHFSHLLHPPAPAPLRPKFCAMKALMDLPSGNEMSWKHGRGEMEGTDDAQMEAGRKE